MGGGEHEVNGSTISSPGGEGGGLGIKFTDVGGPTMVGSDVKKIFEIISCKRAKKHLQDLNLAKYYTAKN